MKVGFASNLSLNQKIAIACAVAFLGFLVAITILIGNKVSAPDPQTKEFGMIVSDLIAFTQKNKDHRLLEAERAMLQAEQYAASRNYSRAHDYFCEATELCSECFSDKSPIASTFLTRQGDFEYTFRHYREAEAAYRRALQAGPSLSAHKNLYLQIDLSLALRKQAKFKESIELLEEAVKEAEKMQPRDVADELYALETLAYTYQDFHHNKQAADTFERVIALRKSQPQSGDNNDRLGDTYYWKASVLEAMKENEKALAAVNQALIIEADEPTYELRARIFEHLGKFENAVADYKQLEKMDSNDIPNYCAMGAAQMQLHRPQDALDTMNKAVGLIDAIKARKKHFSYALESLAYEQRSYAYSALNKPSLAKQDSERATALQKLEQNEGDDD